VCSAKHPLSADTCAAANLFPLRRRSFYSELPLALKHFLFNFTLIFAFERHLSTPQQYCRRGARVPQDGARHDIKQFVDAVTDLSRLSRRKDPSSQTLTFS